MRYGKLREVLGPVLGICLAGYFAYHAVEGERGVLAYLELKRTVAQAEGLHADLDARRAELEHRVRLLRPDSLDPDLLEEQARLMLGYGRPGELVLLDRP